MISKLADAQYIKEQQLMNIQAYSHIPTELFHKDDSKYTEEQRRFAVTLHLYSKKAYDFVREHIPLPHPRSLRR